MGYTQIAVVSYIRRLLVYKHTYPFAPEAASGTYSGEDIYKKTYIYIYTPGHTLIAVVSYIRRLLVLGAPLGSHPPLGKGAPQLGAPLQVGRQRWTCGALWLSPSHQLTESMLQTGASCRTAPPLCAGGAATQKQGAPQLRAPCRASVGGLRSRRC